MTIALLIIDVQKEFVKMAGFKESFSSAKEYINEVSGYFRNAKLPVIHVQDFSEGVDSNYLGLQVSDEIIQEPSDYYVKKNYSNAFWKTNLEELLKEKNVDFVICCGLAASQCVLFTYNGAVERGFGVAMLQNGIIDITKDLEDMVHKQRNVVSYNTIRYLIDNMKEEI